MLGAPARPARAPRRRRRPRAHAARAGEDVGARRRGRHRRVRPPALADDLRAIAAVGGRARRHLVVLAGRHRHPPRGARRAARRPARRHRRADRRRRHSRPFAFRVRATRGRVVSAASPYHSVRRPTGSFLGVLKVAAADRPRSRAPPRGSPRWPPTPPAEWRGARAQGRDVAAALWRAAQRARGGEADEGGGRATSRPTRRRRGPGGRGRAASVPCSRTTTRRALRERVLRRREDATALLLVGLVRAGVHVGAQPPARALLGPPAVAPRDRRRPPERLPDYDEDRSCSTRRSRPATASSRRSSSPLLAVHRALGGAPRLHAEPGDDGLAADRLRRRAPRSRPASAGDSSPAPCCCRSRSRPTASTASSPATRARSPSSARGSTRSSTARRSTSCFAGLAIGATRAGDPAWLLAGAALTLQTVRHSARLLVRRVGNEPAADAAQHAARAAAAERTPAPPARRAAVPRPTADRTPGRAAAPRPCAAHAGVAAAARAAHLARARPAARRALGQEDDRLPDRRALRGDLDHRRAVRRPRVTFIVLLAWGGFAVALHAHRPRAAVGRPMSAAAASTARRAARPGARRTSSTATTGRSRARSARRSGARVPVPAMALLLAGAGRAARAGRARGPRRLEGSPRRPRSRGSC